MRVKILIRKRCYFGLWICNKSLLCLQYKFTYKTYKSYECASHIPLRWQNHWRTIWKLIGKTYVELFCTTLRVSDPLESPSDSRVPFGARAFDGCTVFNGPVANSAKVSFTEVHLNYGSKVLAYSPWICILWHFGAIRICRHAYMLPQFK
jgi:hypothetical protein